MMNLVASAKVVPKSKKKATHTHTHWPLRKAWPNSSSNHQIIIIMTNIFFIPFYFINFLNLFRKLNHICTMNEARDSCVCCIWYDRCSWTVSLPLSSTSSRWQFVRIYTVWQRTRTPNQHTTNHDIWLCATKLFSFFFLVAVELITYTFRDTVIIVIAYHITSFCLQYGIQ